MFRLLSRLLVAFQTDGKNVEDSMGIGKSRGASLEATD